MIDLNSPEFLKSKSPQETLALEAEKAGLKSKTLLERIRNPKKESPSPLDTKIALAQEFFLIGDLSGALILLKEVEENWKEPAIDLRSTIIRDNSPVKTSESPDLQIFENENERNIALIEHGLGELDEWFFDSRNQDLDNPERQIERVEPLMKRLTSVKELVNKLDEDTDKNIYEQQINKLDEDMKHFISTKKAEINNLKNNNMVNLNPKPNTTATDAVNKREAGPEQKITVASIEALAKKLNVDPKNFGEEPMTLSRFKEIYANLKQNQGSSISNNSSAVNNFTFNGMPPVVEVSKPATVAAAPVATLGAREILSQRDSQDKGAEDRGLSKKTWQLLGLTGVLAVGAIAGSMLFGKPAPKDGAAAVKAAQACECTNKAVKKVASKKAVVKVAPATSTTIIKDSFNATTINTLAKEEVKIAPIATPVAAATVGVIGTVSATPQIQQQEILTPVSPQAQIQQQAPAATQAYNLNLVWGQSAAQRPQYTPAATVSRVDYRHRAPVNDNPFIENKPAPQPGVTTSPAKPGVGTSPSTPTTGGVYPKPGVTAPTVNAPIVGGGNNGAPNLNNPFVKPPVSGGNNGAPNLSVGNNSSSPSVAAPRPGAGTGSGGNAGAPNLVNNTSSGSGPSLAGPKKVG